MHPFRTHHCGFLTSSDEGKNVRLSGWLHRKRDHGGLLFIDIRDHFGLTQCVMENHASDIFQHVEEAPLESVVTVTGTVVLRDKATVNSDMPTGDIEVRIHAFKIESVAQPLPISVNSDQTFPEEVRLRYRFLDLRRQSVHQHIQLRSEVITSLRRRMVDQGFLEIQTPILTASSPEGARDFLVPSRLHPGAFYALPQAPQQFKQLLMVSGFDRYFQIAPCFRDEDARADRSPGEFYQLDFELAFATQKDIFNAIEPVLRGVFHEFAQGKEVTSCPFPQITYDKALLTYGTDKPDLRNPLEIVDVSEIFSGSGFRVFAEEVLRGRCVRAIPASKVEKQPRRFFDDLNRWAQGQGAPGMGYVVFDAENKGKGPIAKFLDQERMRTLQKKCSLLPGDGVFFICGSSHETSLLAGRARQEIGQRLNLIDTDSFRFCWVVDFPMFVYNEEKKSVDFSHNPFSMPQGGMKALEEEDPLKVKAYQYDIVCNGVELSSGALRNHKPAIMYKAFEIAGHTRNFVDKNFFGMIQALKYGAPPHGGSAPGIDRIVMLLAGVQNIREIIAFPMNQRAEDLMMGAPNKVSQEQLKALHLQLKKKV